MTRFAAALAARLPAGLIHPGNPATNTQPRALPLPGLSTTAIPPEMAAHFAEQAGLPSSDVPRLLAEAIEHLIAADLDSTIISNRELAQLRQAAADAPDRTRIITVHTTCDRTRTAPLLQLSVTTTSDRTVIPCAALAALHHRPGTCPHKAAS